MDKIVLDTFAPDASCFEPPPASSSQPDKCTVEVTYHTVQNPSASQPSVTFQREKDHYVYAPGNMAIPVLQGLGFDEKSPIFQSTLHFEVFLNGWFRKNYPSFAKETNYKGPDLLPLSIKFAHVIASGDIESPDAIQRSYLSKSLRELLYMGDDSKLWFQRMFQSLTDEKRNLKYTPIPMRPRVQFLLDQLNFFEDLNKSFQAIKGESSDISSLRKQLAVWVVDALDHVATGEKPFKELQADLQRLAKDAFTSPAATKELKDVYVFFDRKLQSLGKQSYLEKNMEAKKRLLLLQAFVKQGVEDHRAELLSLEPAPAFRKSLEYRLEIAAEKGYLASRVKLEMDEANLSNKWIQDHIEEIGEALSPAFTLVQEKGKEPRVKLDVKKIEEATDTLIKNHYIQEREYRITIMASLRYLLGEGLSASKMEGWVKDGYREVEIEISEPQSKKLFAFRDEQGGKISKSVKSTSVVLPLSEGVIAVGGLGLGIYGLNKDKGYRSTTTTLGAIGVGVGGGALACNMLWKSRNQYITDGICGLLAGTVMGLSAGFLLKPAPGEIMGPPVGGPPIDGRNPVSPWGP